MVYDFQVLYRLAYSHPPGAGFQEEPVGELMPPIVVRAESAEQARGMVEHDGFVVHAVGPGVAFVRDGQEWLTKEESAVYVRAKMVDNDSPSLIDKMMADGLLPRPVSGIGGRPLFRRRWLDAAICKRMDMREEAA